MSYQSQQHNMERLSFLLSQDLSYIPVSEKTAPMVPRKHSSISGRSFFGPWPRILVSGM